MQGWQQCRKPLPPVTDGCSAPSFFLLTEVMCDKARGFLSSPLSSWTCARMLLQVQAIHLLALHPAVKQTTCLLVSLRHALTMHPVVIWLPSQRPGCHMLMHAPGRAATPRMWSACTEAQPSTSTAVRAASPCRPASPGLACLLPSQCASHHEIFLATCACVPCALDCTA